MYPIFAFGSDYQREKVKAPSLHPLHHTQQNSSENFVFYLKIFLAVKTHLLFISLPLAAVLVIQPSMFTLPSVPASVQLVSAYVPTSDANACVPYSSCLDQPFGNQYPARCTKLPSSVRFWSMSVFRVFSLYSICLTWPGETSLDASVSPNPDPGRIPAAWVLGQKRWRRMTAAAPRAKDQRAATTMSSPGRRRGSPTRLSPMCWWCGPRTTTALSEASFSRRCQSTGQACVFVPAH